MSMQTHETIGSLRSQIVQARRFGRRIGLVPTMGALHAGHVSLIQAARRECDTVVVSIFVNPTQFGPHEDLARYPRTPQQDLQMCHQAGVDLVFMPSVAEMYPAPSATEVNVPALAGRLCGISRPWHFAGVCLAAAKLFNIVQPDVAYFGAKDFQQAIIIRRMAQDLNFPIRIVICPTVREADGLAMSTRNSYLSPAERQAAPGLYESLQIAREMILQRQPPAGEVIQAIRDHLARRAPGGQIDYVRLANPDTLEDVEKTEPPVLAALAVKLGSTRLIDSVLVDR